MGQIFSDMEPAQFHTWKHVMRMSKNGTSGLCMETRLRQVIIFVALFSILLSIYLLIITNRTTRFLLSIKLCNVTSHVTIIGVRLLPAGNSCFIVEYFLLLVVFC